MAAPAPAIVQRVWNYAHVLRDDGVGYGDYVEQLTYLLFLKMAEEQSVLPGRESRIPAGLDWPSLARRDGPELETHYFHVLTSLARESGILGTIFRKAQNKIQDPAKLRRLIEMIDRETWADLDMDVKGEIYEGLLQRNAEDVKGGAGQYFTPRALIRAMVRAVRPQIGERVCDPACGTGGFLLAAVEHLKKGRLDAAEARTLRHETFFGTDIVDGVVRLCAMNLFLHNVGGDESPVRVADSLASDPGERYEVVLANPPFGKRSSVTVIGEDGRADRESLTYERNDFWATTSNKQLNFLQHIKTILAQHGRAAVVLPDNVLFEGGAGETIRKKLLREYEVHTLLRLPTGIFYAQGVKANVLFFDRKPASETPWTTRLWVYDLRTNKDFTLKTNPLTEADLEDFLACYNPDNRADRTESERFRSFDYDDLVRRDKTSLDIIWLRDDTLEDSASLPAPDVLAREIVVELQTALEQFAAIEDELTVSA